MLTSLERVKDYASLAHNDDDSILSTLVDAVSKRIQSYLGRPIVQTAVTAEKHDHQGKSDRLQVREFPIVSSKGVAVRIDGVAVAAADFEIEDAEAGWLIRTPGGTPGSWPAGRQHIQVDYTHGFKPVPEDIIEAATTQVIWQFNRTAHRGSRLGERSTVSGEGATSTYMVDAWAPEVLAALAPYRRREHF